MLIGDETGSSIARKDVVAGEELVVIDCQVAPTVLAAPSI